MIQEVGSYSDPSKNIGPIYYHGRRLIIDETKISLYRIKSIRTMQFQLLNLNCI